MRKKVALEIRLQGKNIQLSILDNKRFAQHGFGMFLDNFSPEEVAIDDQARHYMLCQPYLKGLRPIEFFNQNTIGFCELVFPASQASVHGLAAKELIAQFRRLKEE